LMLLLHIKSHSPAMHVNRPRMDAPIRRVCSKADSVTCRLSACEAESALLRWVFSHTTQGASHPLGRPHYSSFIIQCLQARVAYITVSDLIYHRAFFQSF